VDLLSRVVGDRIGMYGLSQGGMSALYLPALDVRVKASVSAAYFNWRFVKLIGPTRATCYLDWTDEGQFFSDVVRTFSDSDVVSLIAPRAFAVEAGLHDSAVDFEKAYAEFERTRVHYDRLGISGKVEFIGHAEGHVSATRRAMEFIELNV
jgi:cephalosporin-C deacetylase-like acetyl esterase